MRELSIFISLYYVHRVTCEKCLAHISFRPENDEFEHEFQLFTLICHTFSEFNVSSLKYVQELVVTDLEARDGAVPW